MRQFLTTLVVVWMAAAIAAYFYSQQLQLPSTLFWAILPAFLVEAVFYLAPGFAAVRKAFEKLGPKPVRAALLAISAVLPYLIVSLRTGAFQPTAFLMLLAVVLVASFWYAWMHGTLPLDLAFLAFMAAVYLSRIFDHAYGRPVPHLALAILGRLMWIRLGIMAVLSLRSMEDGRFGFIPSAKEWRTGFLTYLLFLPAGVVLAWFVRFARFHPQQLVWWKFALLLVGTFLGSLWVVALAEEFFFRVFLQKLVARAAHSEVIGLLVGSALFGAAHLWFRQFPNWRFAAIGALAGLFYGAAFLKARSVRASMVTHALVATTWRMLFSG